MKTNNIYFKGAAVLAFATFAGNAMACHHNDDCGSVCPQPVVAPVPVTPAYPAPAPVMPDYGQAPIQAPIGQEAPITPIAAAPVAAPVAGPGFLGRVGGFLGFHSVHNYRCKLKVNHTRQYVLVRARSHREARQLAFQAFVQQAGAYGAGCLSQDDAHIDCDD